MPAGVAADQLQATAYGPAFQTTTQPAAVIFTATEPLPDGVQFQVQVGFPITFVSADRQHLQGNDFYAQ